MMTNEMITKIESKGGNRWTKGNMDRIYMDLSAINAWTEENAEMNLYAYMNRRERQSGKVWFEVATGEIKVKNIDMVDEVVEIVKAYVEA